MEGSDLDAVARELASGEISRRTALRRFVGVGLGLGAVVAPAGIAEAMRGGGCPKGHLKCHGKCCAKNERCAGGKCKCDHGFAKCGKKCVNIKSGVKNCGACGTVCAEGDICSAYSCVTPCTSADDCPPATDPCEEATCAGLGFCFNDSIRGDICVCDNGEDIGTVNCYQGVITCGGCPD